MGFSVLISLSERGNQCLSTDSFPGHVASMTKPLLVQQNTMTETRAHGNAVYLPTTAVPICLLALVCFRTARLTGAGTEQQELTPLQGFKLQAKFDVH